MYYRNCLPRKAKVVALCALLILLLPTGVVARFSQQSVSWGEPERLAQNAGYTVAVSDVSGAVHLFYVEGYRSANALSERAVMYLHRDEGEWSEPVDVIVSPSQTEMYLNAVEVDSEGFLHLLWNDAQALYHSSVHVTQAETVREWRTTLVLTGPIPIADMIQDSSGQLHVLARRDFATISYVTSGDGGQTWSGPEIVFTISDSEEYAIGGIQLASGVAHNLYATWSLNAEEYDWTPWSVWFGRSLDGGRVWDRFQEVATERCGFSDVTVDSAGNVHLVWGRGIIFPDGRWHQWSADDGATWTTPALLFPQFSHASGDTAGYGFALDGEGLLHLVNSFGQGDQSAAYHLVWLGDRWSQPELILRHNAHGTRVVVSLGNQIHFFANNPASGVLWYREGTLDAPSFQGQVVPHPIPDPVEAVSEASIPDSPLFEMTATGNVDPGATNFPSTKRIQSSSVAIALSLSTILTMSLILLVALAKSSSGE